MRKSAIFLGIAVVIAAGVFFVLRSPFGVTIAGTEIGGAERQWLAERSIDFLEDIQFKDMKKASTYHLAKTQKERDIPELIRRVFKIRHEQLDIQDYKVMEVDLDRSKTRGRVKVLVNYHVLGDSVVKNNAEAHRELEMILYWFRQPDGTWTMELESSLR